MTYSPNAWICVHGRSTELANPERCEDCERELMERTIEKENDVCQSCTFECVAGWRKEYNTEECPDCGGLITTKLAKRKG